MANKGNKDVLQEQYELKIQQIEISKKRIGLSSDQLTKNLRSFVAYLEDINKEHKNDVPSSKITEIWDKLNTDLILATKCDLYSMLNNDIQDEIKQESLNTNQLKQKIKTESNSLFKLIKTINKEIAELKKQAHQLLQNMFKNIVIDTKNAESDEKCTSLKNQMLYYAPMFHRKRIRKPVRCLVIDGGGLRGCLSITILQALQEKARQQSGDKNIKISDLFDFIVGTSTGGLIALGLGIKKWSTQKCNRFYNKVAVDVFCAVENKIEDPPSQNMATRVWDNTKWGAWVAWNAVNVFRQEAAGYDEKKLIACITDAESKDEDEKSVCAKGGAGIDENALMYDQDEKEINKPFVAMVAVENSIPKDSYPLLLRNYDPACTGYIAFGKQKKLKRLPGISRIKIWEAARATSAAPSYLRSIEVNVERKNEEKEQSKKFHLIDGGLNANTPALLAWAEASKLWPDREIFMYSVGTGKPKTDESDKLEQQHAGLLSIKGMAFNSYASGQVAQLFTLRVMASMDRLDLFKSWPEIDKDKTEMDDWRHMKYWRQTATKYLQLPEVDAKLDQMAKFLLKHRNDENEEDIFEQAYHNFA